MFTSILTPAAILVLWTLIVMFWMVKARYGAFSKAGIKISDAKPGARGRDLNGTLPDNVMWKAHNYDHLMEQPTIFYAAAFILHLTGGDTQVAIGLAWAYVVLRIIHSIWQNTINTIPVRARIFAISSLCLTALSIMALLSTFN